MTPRKVDISRSPISFLLIDRDDEGRFVGAYWWIRQPGDTEAAPPELSWSYAVESGAVARGAKREAWCRRAARTASLDALCLELFRGTRHDAGAVALYLEGLLEPA